MRDKNRLKKPANLTNCRIKKNIKIPGAFYIKLPSLMFTRILNEKYIFLRHVIFKIAGDNERVAERKNTRSVA